MNGARVPARWVLPATAAFSIVFLARTLFLVDGRLYSTLFDDAMISMRYARHLAEGYGLVWNVGGPRVQGYTNPLWTLLMAAVHVAGTPPRLASAVMMVIGLALMIAIASATYRLARLMDVSEQAASCAAALAGLAYPLVFWTMRGMEVGCLAWLVLEAAGQSVLFDRDGHSRHVAVAGMCLCAACWTRPDALVPAIPIFGYMALCAPSRWRPLTIGTVALAFVGVAGPMLFSVWYFGDPLPNTYYLKLGGAPLTARLARGLPSLVLTILRGVLPMLIVAAAAVAWRQHGPSRRQAGLLAMLVVAQAAYSAYVGGDAWEGIGFANRYLAVALPALAILAAVGIETLSLRTRHRWVFALLMAAAVAAHGAAVVYLARANRAMEAAIVGVYRTHSSMFTLSVGIGAAVVAGLAFKVMRLRSPAAIAALVWLLCNGVPFGRWIVWNAEGISDDVRAVRRGLLIGATLAPEATYAVSRAGATPYFAERTAIDLLGKSDRVVARMAPVIKEFVPGHNKWNLSYSIGTLRPDLACDLPRRAEDVPYLASAGYRFVGGSCFVRAGARLDAHRLQEGLVSLYGPRTTAEASTP